MGTIIKLVIGIVIGVLGAWLVFAMDSEAESTKGNEGRSLGVQQTQLNQVNARPKESYTASSNTEESNVHVAELERELQQIRQELETAVATKEAAIKKLESVQSNDNPPVNRNEKTQSDFEWYSEKIPESHRNVLTPNKSLPKTAFELHKDFVDEGEDIGWALEKEQQIQSYIQNHEKGSGVTIQLVDCKATLCEIYGTTYNEQGKNWDQIVSGMRSQPWWSGFIGSSSSGSSGDDGQYLFATILRRKKP